MEILSVCTGRAWRARVTAADIVARDIVERVRAGEPIPGTWATATSGASQLVGPREFTTEDDPLVDVLVETCGSAVRIVADLAGRRTVLTNVTTISPASPRWTCSDLVRLATAAETAELGLRWMLGWGHLGCIHIDEFAFWGSQTNATALVVNAPERWWAAGAPLPESLGESAFVAYCGPRELHHVVTAVDVIAARVPRAFVGGGMFPADAGPTRTLVAVAEVTP